MRFVVPFLLATLTLSASPAFAEEIMNDNGGRIRTYIERFTRIRDSGERITVDGPCLSACTLMLALVPRDRICVTPNASFGFHAAWSPNHTGEAEFNADATRFLWSVYPAHIRRWLRHNGGLGQSMIYLQGRQLAALYPACTPEHERGGFAAIAARPEIPAQRSRAAPHALARSQPMFRSEPTAAVAATGPRTTPHRWH